MNRFETLHEYLARYGCAADAVTDVAFPAVSLSLTRLRDRLFRLGQILEENETDGVYVVRIPAGFLGMNAAIVAVGPGEDGLYAAGYAREGLIRQGTCRKALAKLEEMIHEEKDDQSPAQTGAAPQEMDESGAAADPAGGDRDGPGDGHPGSDGRL